MRNTIFTSILVAAAVAAAPALAGGPRPGCYERDYTDAHLRKHPAQVVDRITMIVERDQYGQDVARMRVYTANQGHARRDGQGHQTFFQSLLCYDDENGAARCGVECDGGGFVVTRQTGNALTFQTRGLWVGETNDCGGAIDLAEFPRQPVKYLLKVVSESACDGL